MGRQRKLPRLLIATAIITAAVKTATAATTATVGASTARHLARCKMRAVPGGRGEVCQIDWLVVGGLDEKYSCVWVVKAAF